MAPEFYLLRPEELEKHARLVAINGGDPVLNSYGVLEQMFASHTDALKITWAFENFAHVLDDIIDESGCDDETKSATLKEVENWVSRVVITAQKFAAKIPNLYELTGCKPFEGLRGELAEKAVKDFRKELYQNAFSNRYRFEIRALLVSGLMRMLAGDAMKAKGNPLAPAVACAELDFIYHMLFLCRGWDAANRFSVIRQYDVPDGVLEGIT